MDENQEFKHGKHLYLISEDMRGWTGKRWDELLEHEKRYWDTIARMYLEENGVQVEVKS